MNPRANLPGQKPQTQNQKRTSPQNLTARRKIGLASKASLSNRGSGISSGAEMSTFTLGPIVITIDTSVIKNDN